MLWIEGGEARLGRARASFGSDQVHPVEVRLSPFCVDALPFPGLKGEFWLEDGLRAGDIALFERILWAYGRRLCTVEELVWATAMGPANRPYLTGFEPPRYCEPNASWGDMKAMGAHTGCVNGWGVRDANVASFWVRSTLAVEDARGASRHREYVISGGTNREDTFYAPTNFGLHSHDPGDIAYFDDQVRVCADPGGGLEAEWQVFQQAAALQGSFEGALRWFFAHGVEASAMDVLEEPWIYVRDDTQ